MFGSKYIVIVAVLAAACVSGVSTTSARAEEAVPGDKSLVQGTPSAAAEGSEAEAPPPRSPLRLSTVDYQDAGEGPGKLTMAGVAMPGKELYLFLDDEPLANVVPDDTGKWSVETEMKLDEGRHALRADQYDEASQMLAARAMVQIERAKPAPADAAKGEAAPAEPATPDTTTH